MAMSMSRSEPGTKGTAVMSTQFLSLSSRHPPTRRPAAVASLCCSPLAHSPAACWHSSFCLAPSRSALLSPHSTAAAPRRSLPSPLTSSRERVGGRRRCPTSDDRESGLRIAREVFAERPMREGRRMMRDLTCFGDTSVQIADAASSSSSSGTGAGGGRGARGKGHGTAAARSRVTCLYHARLAGRPCALSVTWTRVSGLAGQAAAVSVVAADAVSGDRLCRADVKPWLFSQRKGSRTLDAGCGGAAAKVDVFWDLSGARFFGAAPEPMEGFYVAVVCDGEMVLLLGDMRKEAYRKTVAGRPADDALLVARKEHVVGKKVFSAKAQFSRHGRCHDIAIECDTAEANEPCLVIHIDGRLVMRVRRLAWKFRGNQTILVDGLPVEVFWDVHGWLFGSAASRAVFMFQTCQAPEKSVPWAYLQIFGEPQVQGHEFSLTIHAWKVE